MSIIKIFDYKDLKVSVIKDETDNIWLNAKDVCTILQYANNSDAVKRHIDDDDKTYRSNIDNGELSHNEKHSTYINESGLYALVMGSKMKEAKQFKRWVTSVVLPSIRKNGHYSVHEHHTKKLTSCIMITDEKSLHMKVIHYLRKYYPMSLFISGANLQDTPQKRIESYNMGYIAGTPDIMINNLHKTYSGFVLELKTPKGIGVLSEKQKLMLQTYELNNFKCLVSNDYDDIIIQINDYFKDTRIKCPHCKSCKRLFKNDITLMNHCKYFHRML